MPRADRINSWLSLTANLAILVGIVLVLIELKQNTEHLRLQLRDQINARIYENNRALLAGGATVSAIAKSVTDPENLTYQEFRIVDAHLINIINEWEVDSFYTRLDWWKPRTGSKRSIGTSGIALRSNGGERPARRSW